MKIALFGATGMVGSRIATEATARGHQVTSLSRSTGGDLADASAVREAAAGHDVVVSATGPSRTGGPHEPWLDAVSTLIDNAGDARVLFVGGAGSLLTPDGTRLLDTDGFPPEYLAEATTGAAALELFRAAPDSLDWTFVSPAPVHRPRRAHRVLRHLPRHPGRRLHQCRGLRRRAARRDRGAEAPAPALHRRRGLRSVADADVMAGGRSDDHRP